MAPKSARRAPGLQNLPLGAASRLARLLSRENLARVRSASRGTRDFGAVGTCESQWALGTLKVRGDAVTSAGETRSYEVNVDPAPSYRRYWHDQLFDNNNVNDRSIIFTVHMGDEYVCKGRVRADRVDIRWSSAQVEERVKEQIIDCVVRECTRRAAGLASRYVAYIDAPAVPSFPTTVEQLRTVLGRVRQAGG